jgi:thiol-disulfide isomerase/thioredoxin
MGTRGPSTACCGAIQICRSGFSRDSLLMMQKPSNTWRRLRSNFWLALAFDVILIAAVFFAVHGWQTRDLPIDEPAPETVLALLDGSGIRSAVTAGEAGIVYFFAPWCFYCRTSIGNLDGLVADGKVSWATAIALDYADAGEVREFIVRTRISLPVLMGNQQTAADWSIRAFPTYYVIDADGRISSRSVGYSTKLGMLFRSWLAR